MSEDNDSLELLERELSLLALIKTSLDCGADRNTLLADTGLTESLTALLGVDSTCLSTEDLKVGLDSTYDEGKALLKKKRISKVKRIIAGLAIAGAAVGASIVIFNKMKTSASTSPEDISKPGPTNPMSASKPEPVHNAGSLVVAGARKSHMTDYDRQIQPDKVVHPHFKDGTIEPLGYTLRDKLRRIARVDKVLIDHLRPIALKLHEDAYKAQAIETHLKHAEMAVKNPNIKNTDGYQSYPLKVAAGRSFGNLSENHQFKTADDILSQLFTDARYLQQRMKGIESQLGREEHPANTGDVDSKLLADIPNLIKSCQSLPEQLRKFEHYEVEHRAAVNTMRKDDSYHP